MRNNDLELVLWLISAYEEYIDNVNYDFDITFFAWLEEMEKYEHFKHHINYFKYLFYQYKEIMK